MSVSVPNFPKSSGCGHRAFRSHELHVFSAERTVILFLAVAGISIWQVSKGLGARLGRRLVMSLKTLFL